MIDSISSLEKRVPFARLWEAAAMSRGRSSWGLFPAPCRAKEFNIASLAGSSPARLGSLVQEVFSWAFFCLSDSLGRLSMDIYLLFQRILGDRSLTKFKHLKHSQSLDHIVQLLFSPAVADTAAG